LPAVAYIDASAFVKLFSMEPESDAIRAALHDEDGPLLTASEILSVEAFRAALRLGGEAPAEVPGLLRRIALRPLSSEIRESAQRIGTKSLRALDAIHLATAIWLGDEVNAVFTYDKRLAEASADAGLRVLAPA
jgi:predicted nucleic acid-binding protein